MSASTLRYCVGLGGWGAVLLGALSISRLPGDWGHGICGPWGCGPPLQSLVACHSAWLVALTAPVALVTRSSWLSTRVVRRVGVVLALIGCLGLLGVVMYQLVFWLPQSSEWQRPYFWHRCGFVIATSVDLPLVQLSGLGVALIFIPGIFRGDTTGEGREESAQPCRVSSPDDLPLDSQGAPNLEGR